VEVEDLFLQVELKEVVEQVEVEMVHNLELQQQLEQ
jgi:hypothetical protein